MQFMNVKWLRMVFPDFLFTIFTTKFYKHNFPRNFPSPLLYVLSKTLTSFHYCLAYAFDSYHSHRIENFLPTKNANPLNALKVRHLQLYLCSTKHSMSWIFFNVKRDYLCINRDQVKLTAFPTLSMQFSFSFDTKV